MTATLPWPPSVNRYWRVWRGRSVLSTEGRRYKLAAGLLARKGGMRPLAGPVSLTVRAYRPRRTGDLDNTLKAIGDCLCGVAYVDDDQIVELHAYRDEDKVRPRVEVTVEHVL